MRLQVEMKKTTIQISKEQYFYLKDKALDLQKQDKSASIISILRELINKDMRDSQKKGKQRSE